MFEPISLANQQYWTEVNPIPGVSDAESVMDEAAVGTTILAQVVATPLQAYTALIEKGGESDATWRKDVSSIDESKSLSSQVLRGVKPEDLGYVKDSTEHSGEGATVNFVG